MKIVSVALRSLKGGLTNRFHPTPLLRSLSTSTTSGYGTSDQKTDNSFESAEEFEQRIFGQNSGSNSKIDAFFNKLDKLGKARSTLNGRDYLNGSPSDPDEDADTLSDGMDGELEKAARYFEYDSEEVDKPDYSYRYDKRFFSEETYEKEDLDLTKPAAQREMRRVKFTVTTEEALKKADFRNVRFLANFLTEAGILIKRSQTGISAKAQRKIAREIKTARAFGLMPFTTMGKKAFIFGKTMEGLEEDFEYASYNSGIGADMEGED